MDTQVLSSFRQEWLALHDQADPVVVSLTTDKVDQHMSELADFFYQNMLSDGQASHFLSHDQVKTRLHGSMMQWLRNLNSVQNSDDVDALYAHQTLIGSVHSRIDIPVSLVLKGARHLKTHFADLLDAESNANVPAVITHGSIRLFCLRVDLAMEVMSQAYTHHIERKAKSSEAYRLFSITENLSTEKEKQKAALLDWESDVMFQAALGADLSISLPRIRESEFGLWFRHKGVHAFQGVIETEVISDVLQQVDEMSLPVLEANTQPVTDRVGHIRILRDHAHNVLFQLSSLFEKSLELESGKDVLTHLLNRKFLPTVLTREIELCRKQGREFAVASIDIDHFKRINDTHGHPAGDIVVQHVAALLRDHCRGGDFLFRMGGEEFLVVWVDVDRMRARQLCEMVRAAIQAQNFLLPNDVSVHLTISVGYAVYSGHPDYTYLLRQADEALYRAKDNGRNQVCIA